MTQPDYKWLASERFRATKLHGYDQITTVSQEAINRQIQLMQKKSPPDSPLRRFTTSTSKEDDYTQIVDAQLDPPTVELLLGTDENQTVIFTLKLKSGTFKYLKRSGRNLLEKSATIKDWRIVSRVRLNLLALDDAKVPEFIKKSLTNPNDYSVRQLLIDFTTADISTYDPTLSVLDNDEAKEDFHKHIKMYFDRLKAEDNGSHSTIHYLPAPKKPETQPAPTIVPTSLNFQNYPFVLSAQSESGQKNNENNMLIYLQMTENRKFPPDLLPFPKANWVVPSTPRYDGTVCLSKSTFLDNWLLPRLAQFNNTTTWYSVIDDAPGKDPAPYSLDRGDFGPSGWKNATGTPWTYDAANSNNTVLKYTYTRNGVTKNKGRLSPSGEPYLNEPNFAQQKVYVWNHLEIPVGLDEKDESVIKLSGSGSIWSWLTVPAWTINHFSWTAELVLRNEPHGTENGKLKIEVRNVQAHSSEEYGYSTAPEALKKRLDGVLEGVLSHIKNKSDELFNIMKNLKGDVDKLFGDSWSFLFGQSDDFFIDKAGFNSEGDLLAQLVYKLKL